MDVWGRIPFVKWILENSKSAFVHDHLCQSASPNNTISPGRPYLNWPFEPTWQSLSEVKNFLWDADRKEISDVVESYHVEEQMATVAHHQPSYEKFS